MSHPERLLILLSELNADGGIQRFNRTFVAACTRLGIDCEVLGLNDPADAPLHQDIPCTLPFRGFGRSKARFAAAATGSIGSGRFTRVVIGHIHLLELVAVVRACTFSRIKLLLVVHGTEVWGRIGWLRRHVLRRVDRILCVSEYTRQSILSQASQLRSERLVVFPNALGETWATRAGCITSSESNDWPRPFLLSVGRITRHDRTKGIAAVIRALAGLPSDLHYVIAGGGDDFAYLREVASQHAVAERVHFAGKVTDAELVRLYKDCAAFVLPSSQEGFGIVFLEAMFFGAPVIAAREKGAVDVVRDGETGLLVEYGDVPGIAAAVRLLMDDRALARTLSEHARAQVTGEGEFTFAAYISRVRRLCLYPF